MKKVVGLGVVVAGLLGQAVQADLFSGLNKAAEVANKVTSTTQTASEKLQSGVSTAQSLKSVGAQQLLSTALETHLEPGQSSKADIIALLGEPLKSKTKGTKQTLTYKAAPIVEKLETGQAIAAALGIATPNISGTLDLVLEKNTLQSFNLANMLAK